MKILNCRAGGGGGGGGRAVEGTRRFSLTDCPLTDSEPDRFGRALNFK